MPKKTFNQGKHLVDSVIRNIRKKKVFYASFIAEELSYAIQDHHHPDHSEIRREGGPKLHSSLGHILFLDSTLHI